MREVRTCVVGVGRLGAEHARILAGLEGSLLTGVHDVDRDRGKAVAHQAGTRHFGQLGDLLEAAEAAVVAVPTIDHGPVARAALDNGCHVLVEKPLASTLEEADELIARAEAHALVLGVGHVERFNGAVRMCEPYLDRPRFVESLRLAPFQPRGTDVTVILDLMIHDIDLVLSLVDGSMASLNAVGVPVISGSVDIANARLVFDTGAVANITASRVSMERKRHLRIFQSSGYLSLDLAGGRGEFLRRRPGRGLFPNGGFGAGDGPPTSDLPSGMADVVDRIALREDGEEPLELELRAFLDAVRGEPSPLVPARQGRAALEIALEITRQIEEFAHVAVQNP